MAAYAPAAFAQSAEAGLTGMELIRDAAITAVLLGIITLVLTQFVFRQRIARATYHWLILLGLCVLPITALVGATTTVFEEGKSVPSCATCHVMDPFVYDLQDPESETLAARHFKEGWITENHCYACHTTYGIYGAFEAKRDGFRHWLLYVTNTYEEPITFKGSFPNVSCLDCHQGTPKYEQVLTHQLIADDLANDRVGCYTCHGPMHPLPGERDEYHEESLWAVIQQQHAEASTD